MVDVSSDSRRGEIADYRRLPANDSILTRGGTAYESLRSDRLQDSDVEFDFFLNFINLLIQFSQNVLTLLSKKIQ